MASSSGAYRGLARNRSHNGGGTGATAVVVVGAVAGAGSIGSTGAATLAETGSTGVALAGAGSALGASPARAGSAAAARVAFAAVFAGAVALAAVVTFASGVVFVAGIALAAAVLAAALDRAVPVALGARASAGTSITSPGCSVDSVAAPPAVVTLAVSVAVSAAAPVVLSSLDGRAAGIFGSMNRASGACLSGFAEVSGRLSGRGRACPPLAGHRVDLSSSMWPERSRRPPYSPAS
jgi:hypothetical protein